MSRLCTICHRRPVGSATARHCQPCHRDYMRDWRGPRRINLREKTLAWLHTAPRTIGQLAELLNISSNHASCILYQMRQRGLAERIRRGYYRSGYHG